jgi:hypothetical protein
MPCLLRYTEATKHNQVLFYEVYLEKDSFITFDKEYVDYSEYERLTIGYKLLLHLGKSCAMFE